MRPSTREAWAAAVNGLVLAGSFDLAWAARWFWSILTGAAHRSISMSFERAVFGSSARCEAVIDRLGQRTLFSSGRILDEKGEVCARCQAVVAVARQSAEGPTDAPSG